ncbi:MAG: potassium transporter Kup [Planctomycetes bacterium]|nr:potassium transporter Kup [Planctomycetota bacterium]
MSSQPTDSARATALSSSAKGPRRLLLPLAALGIVYGDIGTSPIYALRECFVGKHAVALTHDNILGVLSLVVWALVLVVSINYIVFILRADNRGEGGVLALADLALRATKGSRLKPLVAVLGMVGAALLYADGILTPSISVLGAVEGLELSFPGCASYVVPITIAILIGLFSFQRRGTASVGSVFGPVMTLWFLVLALLGIIHIVDAPQVMMAMDPSNAVRFFIANGWHGFFIVGTVFLVVTGVEALFADLGHFGRRPIRQAWFAIVLPALLLNYFGQGAMLLENPVADNLFYRLAPDWARLPLVILASCAAVVASQALISGTFSLTMQAMQSGYCPRLTVKFTSAESIGQIYLPVVNAALMVACILVVIGFGSSSRLASAYGIAITLTMVITSCLYLIVARQVWRWHWLACVGVGAMLLIADASFLGANVIKIADGGWVPLLVTGMLVFLMSTWNQGRQVLAASMAQATMPLDAFIADVRSKKPLRVRGTAIFMSSNPSSTPGALLHNLKHNQVLHQHVVILTVQNERIPNVPEHERMRIEEFGDGFHRVIARFGFHDKPDIPALLRGAPSLGLEPMTTSYFLGRETIVPAIQSRMPPWRRGWFTWMSRNSLSAVAFFNLPPNRVVELGRQVEI